MYIYFCVVFLEITTCCIDGLAFREILSVLLVNHTILMRKIFLDSLIIIVHHLLAVSLGKPEMFQHITLKVKKGTKADKRITKFFDFTRKINFHLKKIFHRIKV